MSHNQNKKVVEYYTSLRSFYDTIFEESGYYNLGWLPKGSKGDYTDGQRTLVSKITEPLQGCEGGRILDIGCGQGAPAEQAAKETGAEVVGLELVASQLAVCRPRKSDTLSFVQGDAAILPFANNSFDGIYSIESAFHYQDKSAFITEVARVLKPGGYFSLADIVTSSDRDNPPGLKSMARIAAAETFFSAGKYIAAAERVGLTLTKSEDISSGITHSFQKTAWRTLKYWKKLRREFPAWKLCGVVVISWTHPFFYRWLPVKYQWMVFRKATKQHSS